jgi:hypothetical protein
MTSPFAVTTAEEIVSRSAAVQPRAAPTIVILSAPLMVNLAVYRGDSGQFRITVTDDLGAPVDISGASSWDGDIRVKAIDVDPIANFDIVPVAGDTSSVDVFLTSEESEKLLPSTVVYDIEMTDGEYVTTLIYGTINVTQDVSRT